MTEPFTQHEWEVRKSHMKCIDGMHEPPYDSDYDQMTVNVGEMLRLYATIDYLLARPRMTLEELKGYRRMKGLCLLCGASREKPGEGCYKWAPVNPWREVWAPHSWPEDEPEPREQFDDEPEVLLGPGF